MKKWAMILVLAMVASTAAHAITVTNLDDVEHRVVFEETQGSKVSQVIKPGEVIRRNQVNGEVYLHGSKTRIHPRVEDSLVIWGDGNLQIQMRRPSGPEGL